MDYKYLDQTRGVGSNYNAANADQTYEQPAANQPNYPGAEGASTYQNSAAYPGQYDYAQDPGQQAAYQEGEYGAESTEPSLSDYNSHESCVRITTKK